MEYFKKTPSSIETIRGPILEDKVIEFKVYNKKQKIIVGFAPKTFELLGWKTTDIFQNDVFLPIDTSIYSYRYFPYCIICCNSIT